MSEPRMDKALRAQLLERLSHRAKRLADITAEGHPVRHVDTVIAMMARHVTETAMVLLGETFAREVFSHLFEDMTQAFGICRFCRARTLREDGTMCQMCWDQAQSDDDITDEELEAAVGGGGDPA